MASLQHTFQLAVVQATPALFDLWACLDKVHSWTHKAAANGAQLVLFPEAFIPAYPRGLSFGTVVGSRSPQGRLLWQRYYENAITAGDDAWHKLSTIAKAHNLYLAIGVIEREKGSLYCSLWYFGPDGTFLGGHRKLKPTAAERIIWAEGRGDDLQVYDTPLGKIGGLICWENYMPLARMALYEQEVAIYLAPTADQRDGWQASMQHIALEGRCYVLACNQFVLKTDYPEEYQTELVGQPEIMSRGGSVIFSPLGERLAGPLWDAEGLLMATIDPALIIQSKFDFDVCGHYARPDVFTFTYPKT